MKIQISSFCLSLVIILLFNGCKKEVEAPVPHDPTILKIGVRDAQGHYTASAMVTLYATIQDYASEINPLTSKFTDVNGVATFSDIDTGYYFWSIEYGCQTNAYYGGTWSGQVHPYITSIYNCPLVETGTLLLINNSSDQYEYYFNYIQNGWPIDAGETINLGRNTTTDSIFIRVVQISGIINTPYDSTFNPIITCGNTTIITFP